MADSNREVVVPAAWRLDKFAIDSYLCVQTTDDNPEQCIIKYNKHNLNWLWHLNLQHLEPMRGLLRLLLSLPEKIAHVMESCKINQFEDGSLKTKDIIDIVRLNQEMIKNQTCQDVKEINIKKIFSYNVDRQMENDQGCDLESVLDEYLRNLSFFERCVLNQYSLTHLQDIGEKLFLMSDDLLRCIKVFLYFVHPIWLLHYQDKNILEESLAPYRNKICQMLKVDGGKILFHQFLRLIFWIT